MVAPNRELANTQFPFDISSTSNPQAHLNKAMDMDMDTPRGWSANSSTNNSRESSMHSSVSSIAYADRVQALNNSPSWADQVKSSESQEEITLSYANPEDAFSSVSIFGTNESIDADTQNISTSLFRIAEFVKQRHLGGKTEKDIPHISEFGFAAWNLISSIYESGWDALTANIDSRTF